MATVRAAHAPGFRASIANSGIPKSSTRSRRPRKVLLIIIPNCSGGPFGCEPSIEVSRYRAPLRAGLRFADHRDCAALLDSNTLKIKSEPSRLFLKRLSFNSPKLCRLFLISPRFLLEHVDVF